MTKNTRQPRTDQQLRDASEHLGYEIMMFEQAAIMLASEKFPDGAVKYAVLESFAIHARQLLQFFFPSNPKHTDVLAAHYFTDRFAWHLVRGGKPKALAHIDENVGK